MWGEFSGEHNTQLKDYLPETMLKYTSTSADINNCSFFKNKKLRQAIMQIPESRDSEMYPMRDRETPSPPSGVN